LIYPSDEEYNFSTESDKLSVRRGLMPEEEIGKVMDFFAHPVVAGIDLTGTLKVGDRVHIKGHTTDLELTVDSMQINNVNVNEAKRGDSVGIKVPERVRSGDTVYKITD
jgi:translation initiation factor IF-2